MAPNLRMLSLDLASRTGWTIQDLASQEGECMAVHIDVKRSGDELLVTSPYNKEFTAALKLIGGKWVPEARVWRVPAVFNASLQSLLQRFYPEQMIKGEYVTVRLTVWKTLCQEGELWMLGRKIAGMKKPIDDMGGFGPVVQMGTDHKPEVAIGEDVYFLAGQPQLNWTKAVARTGLTAANAGLKSPIEYGEWKATTIPTIVIEACPRCPTIIELRHFLRSDFETVANSGPNASIMVVPDNIDRPDFSDPLDQMSQVPPAALLSDEELITEIKRRKAENPEWKTDGL